MEVYFLEISQGRSRENECESKFLVSETYTGDYLVRRQEKTLGRCKYRVSKEKKR